MFVEAESLLEPDSEFEVEFTVPNTSIVVQPTARVVWRQLPGDPQRPAGMGLQFLKLDREAEQWLEQYSLRARHGSRVTPRRRCDLERVR
jgi:hypothetical protein